jgi:phage portal protein BeeE
VPPFMVGHSEKSTSWGTGLEQQQIGFLTFALRPWLKRIEAAITRSLLAPGERDTFYAEFSIEGLLRADSTARTAFYSSALTNGWMNRNGVRRLENLPGMGPAGEIFTVQSALIPIDQLGQATPAAVGEPVKNALRTWLGLDEEG